MIINLVKMLKINEKAAGKFTEYKYYEVLAFENLDTAKTNWMIKNPQ